MRTAREVRSHDTRPAGSPQRAALIVGCLFLGLLAYSGQGAAMATAEAAAWGLLFAGLSLRQAGWTSRTLDEQVGALLILALGLSLLSAWAALLPHAVVALPFAPQHLPVPSGQGSPMIPVVRAVLAGGLTARVIRCRTGKSARHGGLGLAGVLATLTATDLGHIDMAVAPVMALPWLLSGWTCVVAIERSVAMPALEPRWRSMLLFSVMLQGALELLALGLHPSTTALGLAAIRLGPLLVLTRGDTRLARRSSVAWAALLVLDVSHGLVSPGRAWTLTELGAVLAATLSGAALAPNDPAARSPAPETA